jgi:galactonate dehydratase
MKITEIKTFPLWHGERNFFFVKVETDEGIYGVGEGGITWKELAMEGAVKHLREALIGQDPTRIEHIWQTLYRGGFFPGGNVTTAAISAIDIALWDILGKSLNLPIYKLLGGAVRDRVVCYPHLNGRSPEEMAQGAKRLVAEGWRFIRFGLPSQGDLLEPTTSVREAIGFFKSIREAVGDETEICIDVHTRLDPADTVYLCRALEEYRPYFVEDPLRAESPSSYHHVRRQTSAPLAVGEQFASKWEFRELIEEELIDYARTDLCIVGGITEARKIAGWCETHYINLAPHNPLGPISTAACLHLDLASINFGVQELPRMPGKVLGDVFPVQVEWRDGYLLPPTRPGLGVEFDEKAALAHPFRMGSAPQLRRLDGSFTNW